MDDTATFTGEYRRGGVTWAAFGALFAFGFLNAVLGPSLPYIRAVEHISYLVGALHQVAYAIGGGLAGLVAAAHGVSISRRATIVLGLGGAALAGIAVAYGDTVVITLLGAFLMSLLGTSALIRVWAVLADIHAARRAVAMTEGEVSVSLAGILTPLLISALAATALNWRFALAIGGAGTIAAAAVVARVGMPEASSVSAEHDAAATTSDRQGGARPTLILILAIVALEFSLSFWLASYLNDDINVARNSAAAMVSGLYAANLVGRLLVSRLARRAGAARLLAGALTTAFIGLPILLAATTAGVAAAGIAVVGVGIGASFPLASSLHVQATPGTADSALGQVLTVAAIGQIAGPLSAGAIAQAAGLRIGLLILPVLVLLAAAALVRSTKGPLTRVSSPPA